MKHFKSLEAMADSFASSLRLCSLSTVVWISHFGHIVPLLPYSWTVDTSFPLPPFLKAFRRSKAREAAVVSGGRWHSSPEWECHSPKWVRRCLHGETVQNRESESKQSGTGVPTWSSLVGDIRVWSGRERGRQRPADRRGLSEPKCRGSEFTHAAGDTGSRTTQGEEAVPKGNGPTHVCSPQAGSEGHPWGHGGSLARGVRAWPGWGGHSLTAGVGSEQEFTVRAESSGKSGGVRDKRQETYKGTHWKVNGLGIMAIKCPAAREGN